MRFEFIVFCIVSYILITLVLWVCAGYAYRVNSKRKADDPLKKDYQPAAIFPIPIWPILAIGWLSIFFLRAAFYALTLILFTIGLVIIRKPVRLIWLTRFANKVGSKLLRANMLLFRILFPQQKPRTME